MINYSYLVFRSVVQLVERRSPKPNVVSSNLATPAIDLIHFFSVYILNPEWDFFSYIKVKGERMIDETLKENHDLKEYVKEHNIDDLSSEELMKLIEVPFSLNTIRNAFNLSEKEFHLVREKKEISNIHLESAIRNIDSILFYLDHTGKFGFITKRVRNQVLNILIQSQPKSRPHSQFYLKELFKIDFSKEGILTDIKKREIDVNYRLDANQELLQSIDSTISLLIRQEKDFLLHHNQRKLYQKLTTDVKRGKRFHISELTYPILYELSIIEDIFDRSIGDLYHVSETKIRNIRAKYGLSNKFKKKISDFPETLIYYREETGYSMEGIGDESIDFIHTFLYLNEEMKSEFSNRFQESKKEKKILEEVMNDGDKEKYSKDKREEIFVELDGEKTLYHVMFSQETYLPSPSKSQEKKKSLSHGKRHHYLNETKIKIDHGKIGEKIVEQFERDRLIKLGLSHLIDKVKIVAQIDEETTFDGTGYDLISFDENEERIFIEVKTSFSNKDVPFFITTKEIHLMAGVCEEYDCKKCFIYYVLIQPDHNVVIKKITANDFQTLQLEPVLYKIKG